MKLIMSQQEFEEALEKARKEGEQNAIAVRFCRDCIHYGIDLKGVPNCNLLGNIGVGEYDYCSFARKKERVV